MAGKRLKKLLLAGARRMAPLSRAESERGAPGVPERDGVRAQADRGAIRQMALQGFALERNTRERAGNTKRYPS